MTTFTNGPARGQRLMLKRAPIFLRVVQDFSGNWDALDQPEDTPRLGETLHAYRLTAKPGACHICTRGPRGGRAGGFYTIASYELVEAQPDQATLSDPEQWSAWCHNQPIPNHLA